MKAAIIAIVSLVFTSGLYWALDSYLINPKVSLTDLDIATKSVGFSLAPAFALPNMKGEVIHSDKLDQKKVTLVHFWASWCAPCVAEFPSLIKAVAKMNGKVRIVAISSDKNRLDIGKFLDTYNIESPWLTVLWDPASQVANQYGADALPETFWLTNQFHFFKRTSGSVDWLSPSVMQDLEKAIQAEVKPTTETAN